MPRGFETLNVQGQSCQAEIFTSPKSPHGARWQEHCYSKTQRVLWDKVEKSLLGVIEKQGFQLPREKRGKGRRLC